MQKGHSLYPYRWWIGLVAVSIIVRLVALIFVPLVPEEAYYWMYAKNPALSYFDHPPMVAWVIGLGTSLFGNSEFGVRIIGSLMMYGAGVFLFFAARMWFGFAASLIAALALQVLPVYAATGFIATMDAPLVFFWTLGLLGVSFALKRGSPQGWFLAGLGCGGAMLSKYTGVFLGVGALLAVLGHRPWRRQLFTAYPYLAAALAVALFSPVIIWNSRHDWASFRFQFLDRFEGHGVDLLHVVKFIGQEFAVATPVVLLMIAWLIFCCAGRPALLMRGRTVVALAFGLPLLTVMAYKSLRYPIHINWTLPAYLSLLPLVSHYLMALARLKASKRVISKRRWSPRGLRWTAMICLIFNVGAYLFLLVGQPRLHIFSAFGPWRELAAIVEEHEDSLESDIHYAPLVLANGKYRLASVLAFYRMPIEDDMDAYKQTANQAFLGDNGLGYPYWQSPEEWIGKDGVYVDKDPNAMNSLRRCFASVEIVNDPRLAALGYHLAICRDYLGPPTP